MRKIVKVLVEKDSGKKFFVREGDEDFHTPFGTVSKKEWQGKKEKVVSDKNRAFAILEPAFTDLWETLQRGPQVITRKDIGLILAKTGVNKTSRTVDAGGGSGALCLALANVCKEVIVYETHPEFYELLLKNKELLGAANLTIKKENVYEKMIEKKLDLITLDLPEPWRVIGHATKSLKQGAFLVVYLPNLVQMKQFIAACRGTDIRVQETVELLERKWKIEEKIVRPEFEMLGHTGFLTFCRRLA